MDLFTNCQLVFLSSRNGTSKDGRTWHSISCHDDRGVTYNFFLSSSALEHAFDVLDNLRLGDKFFALFECNPSFDGRAYRLAIKDIKNDQRKEV